MVVRMCSWRKKSARMQQCFQKVGVVSEVGNDLQVISHPSAWHVLWEISPCLLQAGLQGWCSGLGSGFHGHLCSLPGVFYRQQEMMVSGTNIIVLRNCTVIF